MKDKLKKYLLPNLPYLFFVYLFDKLCQAVRLAPGPDVSEKLLHIGQGFQTAFASSAPSFHALDKPIFYVFRTLPLLQWMLAIK